MVVQRHLSREIRLRDFVALGLDFQRTGAAASRIDTMRLYIACGPGSTSLFQSDHEPARKIPRAAFSAAAARAVLGLRSCEGSALVTCPSPTCGIDPLWNTFTLAPIKDVDGTCRFMVGVQVGVTAADASASPDAIPQMQNAAQLKAKGHDASTVIDSALQNLSMGGKDEDLWKSIVTGVLYQKPHISDIPALLRCAPPWSSTAR
eukprot:jgi/Tetstr1/445951/TSEL_033579.t1